MQAILYLTLVSFYAYLISNQSAVVHLINISAKVIFFISFTRRGTGIWHISMKQCHICFQNNYLQEEEYT